MNIDFKEFTDYIDNQYYISHSLILKRTDLIDRFKDVAISEVDIHMFKSKSIYHKDMRSDKSLEQVYSEMDMVIFLDEGNMYFLKNRYARHDTNLVSKQEFNKEK